MIEADSTNFNNDIIIPALNYFRLIEFKKGNINSEQFSISV